VRRALFDLFFALRSLTKTVFSAEPLLAERGGATRIGRFHGPQDGDSADLSPLLEDTMQLRKEVPLELVVNMFRKLVSTRFFTFLPTHSYGSRRFAWVFLEPAPHHVYPERSADRHDHQNGHCGPVDGSFCPSWRPCG
jgi:hypothetical protein